jgi:hypothetical protein
MMNLSVPNAPRRFATISAHDLNGVVEALSALVGQCEGGRGKIGEVGGRDVVVDSVGHGWRIPGGPG